MNIIISILIPFLIAFSSKIMTKMFIKSYEKSIFHENIKIFHNELQKEINKHDLVMLKLAEQEVIFKFILNNQYEGFDNNFHKYLKDNKFIIGNVRITSIGKDKLIYIWV